MATQEKLFTLTVMESDVEATEQKLKELENEINEFFYDLYGFSEQEKKIVKQYLEM